MEGQPAPSPPAIGGLGERYKLPQRGPGRGPGCAKRFRTFYGHYMAFPDISVVSGHVTVAKYFSAIHRVSAYPELL